MTDIHDIIERLEAGETGREIDFQIRTFDPKPTRSMLRYTQSLDAAAALHERLLPGWVWVVNGYGCAVIWPDKRPNKFYGNDTPLSPAAAWTCTTLKAWAEKEGGDK